MFKNVKRNLLIAVLLLIAIPALALFSLGYSGFTEESDETVDEPVQGEVEHSGAAINTGDVPECLLGHCPSYLQTPWYIYGQDPAASVVVVPTTMNRAAGQVWVIHFGEVVYKSPTFAGVDAKIEDDKLYITHIGDYHEDGITPKTFQTDRLLYEDGEFELIEVSTEEFNYDSF